MLYAVIGRRQRFGQEIGRMKDPSTIRYHRCMDTQSSMNQRHSGCIQCCQQYCQTGDVVPEALGREGLRRSAESRLQSLESLPEQARLLERYQRISSEISPPLLAWPRRSSLARI